MSDDVFSEKEEHAQEVKSEEERLAAGRAAAFATSNVGRDAQTFEHEGCLYEYRAPTLELEEGIKRQALETVMGANGKPEKDANGEIKKRFNNARAGALTFIACIYLPGTDKRYFTKAHLESLLKAPTDPGSFIHKAARCMKRAAEIDPEEEEKNSESDPSSAPSF